MLDSKRTSKFFDYFLVFATMVFSGSYLLVVELPTIWVLLGLVIVFGIYCLYKRKITLKFLPIKYIVFFVVSFLITYVANHKTDTLGGLVGSLLPIIFACLVVLIVPWDNFKKAYVNVMLFLTIISIIMYYLGSDFMVRYGIPMHHSRQNITYYSIIIYSYAPAIVRNCGFFWEPGLFATALVYAIVLLNQKALTPKSLLYNIIFVCGILSTKSTAGYALIPIVYFYVFTTRLQKNNKYYTQILIALIILLFIGVLCFIFLDEIIYGLNLQDVRIFQKLLRENLIKNPRVIAVQENLKYFAQYFMFGTGYVKGMEFMAGLDCFDTATAFVMLSRYGILGIGYTFMIVHAVKNAGNISMPSKVSLFALLFLLVNKEPNNAYVLSWIFIFYLLNREKVFYNKKSISFQENTVSEVKNPEKIKVN